MAVENASDQMIGRKTEVVELSSSEDEDSRPGSSEPLPSCPICLTDILDPLEKAVTGCVHTFCRSCLAEWLRFKRFCPLCKRRIRTYVTYIRDDSTFTEVEVPPSPVHDRNPPSHRQHQPYHDLYSQHFHQRQLHQHQGSSEPRGGDRSRDGESSAISAWRRQLYRNGDAQDLLRQLHRIADRLTEAEDASFESGSWSTVGAPRFRRASTSTAVDGSEGAAREGGRWSGPAITAPRSQQQQEAARREPRPYFFRLQQRLAATAAATGAADAGSDPWDVAAAAAAAYTAAAPPTGAVAAAPAQGTLRAGSIAGGAMAGSAPDARVLAAAPVDEQSAAVAARRRIYELGLWAVGVAGGGAAGCGGFGRRTAGGSVRAPAVAAIGGPPSSAAVVAAAIRSADRREHLERWVMRELQALLGATDLSLLRALVVGLVEHYGVERDWPSEEQQQQEEQRATAAAAAGEQQMGPVQASAAAVRGAQAPLQQQQQQQAGQGSGGGGGTGGAAAVDGPLASLRPFLMERSGHFWHELRHFVLSGLALQAYDARVQYRHDGGSTATPSVAAPPVATIPARPPPPPLRRARLVGAPLALAPVRPGRSAAGAGGSCHPHPNQPHQRPMVVVGRTSAATAAAGEAPIKVVDLTLVESPRGSGSSAHRSGRSSSSGSASSDNGEVSVGRRRRKRLGSGGGARAAPAAADCGAPRTCSRVSGGGRAEAAGDSKLGGHQARPTRSRWEAVAPGGTGAGTFPASGGTAATAAGGPGGAGRTMVPYMTLVAGPRQPAAATDPPATAVDAVAPAAATADSVAKADGRPAKRRRRWDEWPRDVTALAVGVVAPSPQMAPRLGGNAGASTAMAPAQQVEPARVALGSSAAAAKAEPVLLEGGGGSPGAFAASRLATEFVAASDAGVAAAAAEADDAVNKQRLRSDDVLCASGVRREQRRGREGGSLGWEGCGSKSRAGSRSGVGRRRGRGSSDRSGSPSRGASRSRSRTGRQRTREDGGGHDRSRPRRSSSDGGGHHYHDKDPTCHWRSRSPSRSADEGHRQRHHRHNQHGHLGDRGRKPLVSAEEGQDSGGGWREDRRWRSGGGRERARCSVEGGRGGGGGDGGGVVMGRRGRPSWLAGRLESGASRLGRSEEGDGSGGADRWQLEVPAELR